MFRDEVLENEKRREIYHLVDKNPGLHLREIQRRLEIPLSTLNYHLDYLVRYNLLKREVEGHFSRFYAKDVLEEERRLLKVLRHRSLRHILLIILSKGKIRHQELREFLNIPASTLSFYLNRLIQEEAVSRNRIGRENYYTLNDEYSISRLLIIYRSSFMDSLIDRVVSTWMEKNFKISKEKK